MGNRQVDWEAIAREYRAGQLSVRQIARQHDVSESAVRKKARQRGWQRDLSEAVRRQVRAELAREAVPAGDPEAIVSDAAARGVEVVREHRRDLLRARALVGVMLGQLQDAAVIRSEMAQAILEATQDDHCGRRRNALLRAVSLPAQAGVVRDLAMALRHLIPLERQAFSLDDAVTDDEDPIRALLTEVANSPQGSPMGRLAQQWREESDATG